LLAPRIIWLKSAEQAASAFVGGQAFAGDGVNAEVPVDDLGDAEIDADRQQRDGLFLGEIPLPSDSVVKDQVFTAAHCPCLLCARARSPPRIWQRSP